MAKPEEYMATYGSTGIENILWKSFSTEQQQKLLDEYPVLHHRFAVTNNSPLLNISAGEINPPTKGDITREYAVKHNIPLMDIPLVEHHPDDLKGLPIIKE